MITEKRNICIDFDGTISINNDKSIPVALHPFAKEAINILKQKFRVIIFSARNAKCFEDRKERIKIMRDFLDSNDIYYDEIADTKDGKVPAEYYIDDRAIQYKNNWVEIINNIRFTP